MPYFIISRSFLVPSFDLSLKERGKLDIFLDILEQSGVGKIIEENSHQEGPYGGREPYNPYRLFASCVYGFCKHSGSLRKIEESINYDLRFIYLMEQERPSYVSISKFLNNVVVKRQREIYSVIVKEVVKRFSIDTSDVFLDGTKFEANANKYKFVWKPRTFHSWLNNKIRALLSSYFSLPSSKTTFVAKEVGEYLSRMNKILEDKGINPQKVIRGKGQKIDKLVKDYFLLSSYMMKALSYEEEEEICGPNRNSYFKTDHSATAMCLKADYYSGLGSDMHAAYNVQILVSKGLILDYYVSQEISDFYAFVPFLDQFYNDNGSYPKRLCADAGYGSLLTYRYIHEHKIGNYIKYNMWEEDVKGRNVDLFSFDEEGHLFCLNGRRGEETIHEENRHPRRRGNKFYLVNGCLHCRYKSICGASLKHKIQDSRIFEANQEMYFYKQEARANLLSTKGIEMRINRSSQVEGSFGMIKQDMNYDRVRRRGLENVSAEIMMVCLGHLFRKVFGLIDGTGSVDYWKAPDGLKQEEMAKPNYKKILKRKRRVIGKNESLRKRYKYKTKKKSH
jgi:transposase